MEKRNYDSRCPYYKSLEISDIRACAFDTNRNICTIFYDKCNSDNHLTCPRYLMQNDKLTEELEKEREKYISSMPHSD